MAFVSFRLEKELLDKVELYMKDLHFSTKTEFVREAVREKITAIEKEKRINEQWDKLLAMRGTLTGIAKTDEEFRKLKEEAGAEFFAEWEKDYAKRHPNQKQPLPALAPQCNPQAP
jgi:metal-responsive CopG/Arc/MetJ family transcriptional regulator